MTAPSPLIVGSWPGRGFAWNSFVATFCDAVAAAGCRVVDVDDPRRIPERLDVLHIHWPEQVFWGGGSAARLAWRTLATWRALRRLQRSGTRLVWMVHNLQPHDRGGARRRLWSLFAPRLAGMVDGWMTLSAATVAVVAAAYPALARAPVAAPWHPRYAPLPVGDRATCRAGEGLPADAIVTAFLGLLRPYKGVEALIAAFRGGGTAHDRLLIAGEPDSADYGAHLAALGAGDPRIEFRLGRLADDAMARLVTAADRVALPFRDYLHSGSMIYALSYGRAVVTPSTPFADALGSAVGPGWVRTYRGPLDASALAAAAPPGEPDLAPLSPALLGDAAVSLYRRLCSAGPRR